MDKDRLFDLFKEFFRYVIVGGLAFLVDSGTLALFRELIFNGGEKWELFASSAAGFIAGLIFNYVLSLIFVFRSGKEQGKGKDVKSFIIFAVIGLIGLGLTELGMYIGVYLIGLHYLLTKVGVAAIVLIWNYAGRKILIFR